MRINQLLHEIFFENIKIDCDLWSAKFEKKNIFRSILSNATNWFWVIDELFQFETISTEELNILNVLNEKSFFLRKETTSTFLNLNAKRSNIMIQFWLIFWKIWFKKNRENAVNAWFYFEEVIWFSITLKQFVAEFEWLFATIFRLFAAIFRFFATITQFAIITRLATIIQFAAILRFSTTIDAFAWRSNSVQTKMTKFERRKKLRLQKIQRYVKKKSWKI